MFRTPARGAASRTEAYQEDGRRGGPTGRRSSCDDGRRRRATLERRRPGGGSRIPRVEDRAIAPGPIPRGHLLRPHDRSPPGHRQTRPVPSTARPTRCVVAHDWTRERAGVKRGHGTIPWLSPRPRHRPPRHGWDGRPHISRLPSKPAHPTRPGRTRGRRASKRQNRGESRLRAEAGRGAVGAAERARSFPRFVCGGAPCPGAIGPPGDRHGPRRGRQVVGTPAPQAGPPSAREASAARPACGRPSSAS